MKFLHKVKSLLFFPSPLTSLGHKTIPIFQSNEHWLTKYMGNNRYELHWQ